MNKEKIIDSFTELKSLKMINRPSMIRIVEDVLRAEIKKKFSTDENFDIIINSDNGDIEIWQSKKIVNVLNNSNLEILLEDAKLFDNDYQLDEDFIQELKLSEFGRRSILNIKQSLKNKIKNFESQNIVDKFNNMIGYTYSAEVKHIKKNMVILIDSDGNEFILNKLNQIPNEFYKKGNIIKGVIESATIFNGKPIINLSRTSSAFLEALLENEIPEIFEGLITIKNIVRMPGIKAKVLVESYDDRIDPVGICIGMKGSRINNIVKELNGENIDIINYTKNTNLLVSRCLKPAKIDKVDIIGKNIEVNIKGGEIPKAIGKSGANIKLASQLIGYDIHIYNDEIEYDEDIDLIEFKDEIDEWIIDEFKKIGLDTARSILSMKFEDLVKRTDLEEETIENIIKIIKDEFKEE